MSSTDQTTLVGLPGARGFALAILTALIVLAVPGPQSLPPEGQRMAAIFAVVLVLWVTEAVPVAVTALLAVVLQPMFRVGDLPTAFSTFISPVDKKNLYGSISGLKFHTRFKVPYQA